MEIRRRAKIRRWRTKWSHKGPDWVESNFAERGASKLPTTVFESKPETQHVVVDSVAALPVSQSGLLESPNLNQAVCEKSQAESHHCETSVEALSDLVSCGSS